MPKNTTTLAVEELAEVAHRVESKIDALFSLLVLAPEDEAGADPVETGTTEAGADDAEPPAEDSTPAKGDKSTKGKA